MILLEYSDDLISHYQSLSVLPGFVLLESGDKGRGRYDVVTALPYQHFQLGRDDLHIKDALERLESLLPLTPSFGDFPFQGGAIGYVSYDFADVLAGISREVHPDNDLPLILIGLYDWAIVVDHQTQMVSLVSADLHSETQDIIQDIRRRWTFVQKSTPSFYLEKPFAPLITQKEYQQAFSSIHQELVRGRAYQVCYTQPFLGHFRGETWDIYQRIRASNPVPYAAFLRSAWGDLICFSPERFLKIDEHCVQASPIKGTAKRSSNPKIDAEYRHSLLNSTKNRAENLMIVDLLRNDLSRFAIPKTVEVTALCDLESYHGLHHLVSHIKAQTPENISPLQVFKACFPGGSITGAPKREAMRIISEHERYARGVYCGNLFYLSNHGRFESNIAIRTITAKEDSLYLSAGGGIVMDSSWDEEYQECLTKLAGIVKALG